MAKESERHPQSADMNAWAALQELSDLKSATIDLEHKGTFGSNLVLEILINVGPEEIKHRLIAPDGCQKTMKDKTRDIVQITQGCPPRFVRIDIGCFSEGSKAFSEFQPEMLNLRLRGYKINHATAVYKSGGSFAYYCPNGKIS